MAGRHRVLRTPEVRVRVSREAVWNVGSKTAMDGTESDYLEGRAAKRKELSHNTTALELPGTHSYIT